MVLLIAFCAQFVLHLVVIVLFRNGPCYLFIAFWIMEQGPYLNRCLVLTTLFNEVILIVLIMGGSLIFRPESKLSTVIAGKVHLLLLFYYYLFGAHT